MTGCWARSGPGREHRGQHALRNVVATNVAGDEPSASPKLQDPFADEHLPTLTAGAFVGDAFLVIASSHSQR